MPEPDTGQPGQTGEPGLPVCEFVTPDQARKLRTGAARSHLLPKACGLRAARPLHIIDATAGLGRDAFLLASLGATVTLIERNAIVHRLLSDALARARACSAPWSTIAERMQLLHGDAKDLLAGLDAKVILIDPMHPARTKSALVKKPMRQLRAIAGPDEDAADLVLAALGHATGRVVLKWPVRAGPLPQLPVPSHTHKGKTTRYDVFMCQR